VATKAIYLPDILFLMRPSMISLSVIWYLRFSTPGIRIMGVPSVYPYPVVHALPRKLAILDV
jgi:hypothetical protein